MRLTALLPKSNNMDAVFLHPYQIKHGPVMVSTGIMKLEKRAARDASNSKIKIKR